MWEGLNVSCIGFVVCGKVLMFPVLDWLYVERVKCFLYWTCCMSESVFVSCIGLVLCGKGLNVFQYWICWLWESVYVSCIGLVV